MWAVMVCWTACCGRLTAGDLWGASYKIISWCWFCCRWSLLLSLFGCPGCWFAAARMNNNLSLKAAGATYSTVPLQEACLYEQLPLLQEQLTACLTSINCCRSNIYSLSLLVATSACRKSHAKNGRKRNSWQLVSLSSSGWAGTAYAGVTTAVAADGFSRWAAKAAPSTAASRHCCRNSFCRKGNSSCSWQLVSKSSQSRTINSCEQTLLQEQLTACCLYEQPQRSTFMPGSLPITTLLSWNEHHLIINWLTCFAKRLVENVRHLNFKVGLNFLWFDSLWHSVLVIERREKSRMVNVTKFRKMGR